MSIAVTVYAAILFFVLTPGVVLSLPAGAPLMTKAAVHAVVFGVVFYLTKAFVMRTIAA
jgi:hypothetical protein